MKFGSMSQEEHVHDIQENIIYGNQKEKEQDAKQQHTVDERS